VCAWGGSPINPSPLDRLELTTQLNSRRSSDGGRRRDGKEEKWG